MGYKSTDIESLRGEVLTHIDVSDDEIMLTTESGRKILIYHSQDCCESVSIEGIEGDFKDLVGKVIIDVSEETDSSDSPPDGYCESFTRTTHVFRVNDATVISKWIGTSNGYYSESVHLADIA